MVSADGLSRPKTHWRNPSGTPPHSISATYHTITLSTTSFRSRRDNHAAAISQTSVGAIHLTHASSSVRHAWPPPDLETRTECRRVDRALRLRLKYPSATRCACEGLELVQQLRTSSPPSELDLRRALFHKRRRTLTYLSRGPDSERQGEPKVRSLAT